MQLYNFITICLAWNISYNESVAPQDSQVLEKIINSINGTKSIDVTWLLNENSHLSTSWRMYEERYIKFLSSGIGLFMYQCYYLRKYHIFNQERNISIVSYGLNHLEYLQLIK